MKETAIEKRVSAPLTEKGQYALAFSVIAAMLYAAGFPIFLLFFVGVLAFFISKVFSAEAAHETRKVFEFYLSANEILREDDRRWYGFEIQETIHRGESIIRSMSAAPPLVSFALGVLYQKLDDHGSAVRHLSHVVGDSAASESAIVFPNKELREYVRMLRKIERAPAEAPLTSSAVRSLERARKNKGMSLLEFSRSQLANDEEQLPQIEQMPESVFNFISYREEDETNVNASNGHTENETPPEFSPEKPLRFTEPIRRANMKRVESDAPHADRKSISEVLHDIYDKNIQ